MRGHPAVLGIELQFSLVPVCRRVLYDSAHLRLSSGSIDYVWAVAVVPFQVHRGGEAQ
jgi:hypothetical protein